MLVLLCVRHDEPRVELATPEQELYKESVNKLSQASHVLNVMLQKSEDPKRLPLGLHALGI